MSLSFNPKQTRRLYSDLPSRSQTIRLVTLLPGSGLQRLFCKLHEAQVGDEDEDYKALSYAWNNGTESADVSIICNMMTIKVSSNLQSALLRLRSPDQPVKIWVDSLCINQKNAKERTQQVGMMREIYQRSSEVVIWLGDSGPEDDLGEWLGPLYEEYCSGTSPSEDSLFAWSGDETDLFKVKAHYSQDARLARNTTYSATTRDVFGAFCALYSLSIGVSASRIPLLCHLAEAGPVIRGFEALAEKSWWGRVWVVQEVVVATRATMYYGKMSAPWSFFSKAAMNFEKSRRATNVDSMYAYVTDGWTLRRFSRLVAAIESTRREWELVEPTVLLPLIRKFRSRQASDARDKVFALLGLVRFWAGGKRILPDYGHEVTTTYFETAKFLISSVESLSVLAGTLRDPASRGGQASSWVTDWSYPPDDNEHIRLSSIVLFNAARHLKGTVRLHGYNLLETPAYYVDEVAFVGETLLPSAARRMRDVVTGWYELSRHAKRPYVGGGTGPDAFWRTICGDLEIRGAGAGAAGRGVEKLPFVRATAKGAQTWEKWHRADRRLYRTTSIIGGSVQEVSGVSRDELERNAFHHAVECAAGGRRFFVTEQGYMGTGPADTVAGDDVFVLCGSQVPFVLRGLPRGRTCRDAPLETLFSRPAQQQAQRYIPVGRGARAAAGETAVAAVAGSISSSRCCGEDHLACYAVVGDAYVHGVMDGEGACSPVGRRPKEQDVIFLA
ncbi:heterokaryon incompatibility protein-domain-containing protein [Xylariaceae sp. FL0804]|nr:heterokaryon incompatibility protein-domain-containing protein [Xylariaceae sp. FL0804]